MSGTPTSVAPIELATTAGVLYTVPAGFAAIIKEMLVVGSTAAAAQVQIDRRTLSGADYRIRVKSPSNLVAISQAEIWHLDLMLGSGETLRGSASLGTGIQVHISVIELTTANETEYPLLIPPVVLTTGDTTAHTVGAGFTDIIKELLFTTTNGSAQVSIIRQTAAGVNYPIRKKNAAALIADADTEIWHLDLMLDESEKLILSSSTTQTHCQISAVRTTNT